MRRPISLPQTIPTPQPEPILFYTSDARFVTGGIHVDAQGNATNVYAQRGDGFVDGYAIFVRRRKSGDVFTKPAVVTYEGNIVKETDFISDKAWRNLASRLEISVLVPQPTVIKNLMHVPVARVVAYTQQKDIGDAFVIYKTHAEVTALFHRLANDAMKSNIPVLPPTLKNGVDLGYVVNENAPAAPAMGTAPAGHARRLAPIP